MKKLITLIPTAGKSLKDMQKTVDDMWPEIQKKLKRATKSKGKKTNMV
jgi:Sec-independent protein translocase protein TatA